MKFPVLSVGTGPDARFPTDRTGLGSLAGSGRTVDFSVN
jgi:hypothetical protein